MKKTWFLCLLGVMAMAFAFSSCGDDDDTVPDNGGGNSVVEVPEDPDDGGDSLVKDTAEYIGMVHAVVDFNGEAYDCGEFDASAVLVTDAKGAVITIHPMAFDITVPMMGSMQIATAEDIVVKGEKGSSHDGVTEYTGTLNEQMVNTIMRGQEMQLPMSGTINIQKNGDGMAFRLDVTQWGSMPFGLSLEFAGTETK